VSAWQLAQINIGRFLAPTDDPRLADFMDALDRINALAEGQPGFVWRLTGEGSNNATEIRVFDDPMMAMNMSVWESLEALAAFVYRSDHREVMRRRREWFEVPAEAFQALWWVSAGRVPTPHEGRERLEALRRDGPSPFAFTFREPFGPPGAATVDPVLDECA
jgi:heme-degrading monooxygenase HmoA